MEFNKNDSLFTYMDSLDTQEFYTNYGNKKIPKLNKYAKLYLLKLEKENSNKETNSNNSSRNNNYFTKENLNDNASSIKDLSNDITNNDSIIKNFHYKNASNESNQLKTIDYSAIEKLKKNIESKSRKVNVISKVNTFTINHNYIKNSNNKMQESEKLNKYFNTIVPSEKKKMKSHLFFNFSLNKDSKLNRNINSLNNIKTPSSLYFKKTKNLFSKEKILFHKINTYNKNKYKFKGSPLVSNICSNFIKKYNSKIHKKNLISNTLTENSYNASVISKNSNKNNGKTITLNDYWIEKEIKKNIKIMRLFEEKKKKEASQLREKPKINRNSRIIAERLCSNNSINVFERLSESSNKILFNGRKSEIFSKSNNRNKKTYISKNTYGNEENFKTFKQLEKKEEIKKINKNHLVQKIMTRNNENLKKAETHRINNKYKHINNKNKNEKKFMNKNEKLKIWNNSNIFITYNSTENISRNINPINRNQSLESFNEDKISKKSKIYYIKMKKDNVFNQKNKTIRTIGNIEDIYPKISKNKLLVNELKNKSIIIPNKINDEKLFNKNKFNNPNIKNSNNKNIIYSKNSFNTKRKYDLNISSTQTIKDIYKIKVRRKIDLLKLLNFSSNIGINNKS